MKLTTNPPELTQRQLASLRKRIAIAQLNYENTPTFFPLVRQAYLDWITAAQHRVDNCARFVIIPK